MHMCIYIIIIVHTCIHTPILMVSLLWLNSVTLRYGKREKKLKGDKENSKPGNIRIIF